MRLSIQFELLCGYALNYYWPFHSWQYKRARTVMADSSVNGHTCTTAKESVVQKTGMEVTDTNVTKKVRNTVAIASPHEVSKSCHHQ